MELDHRIQGNGLVDVNKHLNYAYSPNENGKSLLFHKKDSVPVCNILLVTRQESHNVPVQKDSCAAGKEQVMENVSQVKVSLFKMMTFKTVTTFMALPPAATFLASHP